MRDWCRCDIGSNEIGRILHWKWPMLYKQMLYKQQNSMTLISKHPPISNFNVWSKPNISKIKKTPNIGNFQKKNVKKTYVTTCSLEIPCSQCAAVPKPTEHNDEDQSWDNYNYQKRTETRYRMFLLSETPLKDLSVFFR